MLNDIIEEIRLLYNSGEQDKAKKQLDRVLRRGRLTSKQKLQVAKIYYLMGDIAKSLKIHGREIPLERMMELSIDELSLVMSLSRLLHHAGAPYAGKRIFWKIDESLVQRKINPLDIDLQYPMYKLTMLRMEGRSQESLKVCREAMTVYDSNMVMYYYSAMAMVDNLRSLGNYSEAKQEWERISELTKTLSNRAKGILMRARSELMYEDDRFQEALEAAEEAMTYFSDWPDSIESCVVMRCRADALIALGRKEEALPILQRAYEHAQKGHHPATMIIRILYILETYFPAVVTISQQVAARCHQVYSSYSYLLGKRHDPDKTGPLPFCVQKKVFPVQDDCWVVDQDKIRPAKYNEIVQESNTMPQGRVFDFVSGLVIENGTVVDLLQELQLRAMAAFIGNGVIGVSLWGIVDLIYREEPYNFNYGEERLKAIISSLKEHGIAVAREDNYYYLRSPIPKMIFPMGLPTVRRWRLLAARFPYPKRFMRMDVEQLYQVEKTTAGRWLKKGQEEGEIISYGQEYSLAAESKQDL